MRTLQRHPRQLTVRHRYRSQLHFPAYGRPRQTYYVKNRRSGSGEEATGAGPPSTIISTKYVLDCGSHRISVCRILLHLQHLERAIDDVSECPENIDHSDFRAHILLDSQMTVCHFTLPSVRTCVKGPGMMAETSETLTQNRNREYYEKV